MENAEFESSLIIELNRVLLQAAEEVESEQRLDLAYEVLETVRFEQAHTSWLDRIRNTSNSVELRLTHAQLPLAFGEVKHVADPFLILENETAQFLVNLECVYAIAGLSERSRPNARPDGINWLDNVWFHDLADQNLLSTWYLKSDQVIEGVCVRSGFDSIDVETSSKIFTIPKRSIVSGRTLRSS